jgi:agmatinase
MKDPKFIIDSTKNGQLIVSDDKLTNFWKTDEVNPKIHSTYKSYSFFDFPSNFILDKPTENILEVIGVPFSGGSNFSSSSVGCFSKTLRYMSTMTPIYMSLDAEHTSGLMDLNTQEKLLLNCIIDDLGDIKFNEHSVNELKEKIRDYFNQVQKEGSKFAFIGGDHSITYYILKELRYRYEDILYIHFDAHLDCGSDPLRLDEKVNHGNFVRHLLNENIVGKVLQLGVRGLRSLGQYYEDSRLSIIPSAKLNKDIFEQFLEKAIEKKSFIYVSFDVDVLDPNDFSAVDFPSPGGPNINTIIECIQILGKYPNFIGLDFVEGRGSEIQENVPEYQIVMNIFTHLLDALSKSQS